MYEPETRVSSPVRLPAVRRGRTTQKRAWSVRIGSASPLMRTWTTTLFMSFASLMLSTVPSGTALCFTCV